MGLAGWLLFGQCILLLVPSAVHNNSIHVNIIMPNIYNARRILLDASSPWT
jgi:hypothetical protein